MKPPKKEGNVYDKIFKENAMAMFLPVIEHFLKIKIKHFTPYKEKLQTTLERELDFLYAVETESGDCFDLHIEFEIRVTPQMVYRIGEYHGIVQKRRQNPIRHVVIYLGEEKMSIPTLLEEEQVYKGFDLISLNALDPHVLLSSQVPEVIIMAILGHYSSEQVEGVLRLLLRQFKVACKNDAELRKYLKQLLVLSRLRTLEGITSKIKENMSLINYTVESDVLYQEGLEKGITLGEKRGEKRGEKEQLEKNIRALLLSNRLDPEEVAEILDVSLGYVLSIQQSL